MDTDSKGAANAHDFSPPSFPVVTVIASVLVLGFFALLVGMVHYYANQLDTATPVVSGEQKLAELKASQDEQTKAYAYDPATRAARIPVEVSVAKMVEEGERNGKLPFPMKPPAKPAEAKPATPPAKAGEKEPAKADAKAPEKK